MKEYIGRKGYYKVAIDGDNFIVYRKNNVEEICKISDIIALAWQEPPNWSGVGTLYITTKKEEHSVLFRKDSLEQFVELRDALSDKSGCIFSIKTFGDDIRNLAKLSLRFILMIIVVYGLWVIFRRVGFYIFMLHRASSFLGS